MKCAICGRDIEETFLEKIKGTTVRIRKDDNTKVYYVCDVCQKGLKGDLKKKILEMN